MDTHVCGLVALTFMHWQVMLAQQESIAQLMGVYEEIKGRGDGASGQNTAAYVEQEQHVDTLQLEHKQGKSRMKKERLVAHTCWLCIADAPVYALHHMTHECSTCCCGTL